MPNIRYVCLSDLHLGEEDSLLTNITSSGEVDTASPSPTLQRLSDCIYELLRHNEPGAPVALILNGDILELALSTMDKAMLVFEQFLRATMPRGREAFEEIVYIPGNHDHRHSDSIDGLTRLEFAEHFNPQVQARFATTETQPGYWSITV